MRQLPFYWLPIPAILIKRGTVLHREPDVLDYLQGGNGATVSVETSTGITASLDGNDLIINYGTDLPDNAYVVLKATRGTEVANRRVPVEDYLNVLLADPPPDFVQGVVTYDASDYPDIVQGLTTYNEDDYPDIVQGLTTYNEDDYPDIVL